MSAHSSLVLPLLLATLAAPGTALAGPPDAPPRPAPERARTPPVSGELGWVEGGCIVGAWGCGSSQQDASVEMRITDAKGESRFSGDYLTVDNRGEFPFWFGLSGSLDKLVPARASQRFKVRSAPTDERTGATNVGVYYVFFDPATVPPPLPKDAVFSCGEATCCVPAGPIDSRQCTCPEGSHFDASTAEGALATSGTCALDEGKAWDSATRAIVDAPPVEAPAPEDPAAAQ